MLADRSSVVSRTSLQAEVCLETALLVLATRSLATPRTRTRVAATACSAETTTTRVAATASSVETTKARTRVQATAYSVTVSSKISSSRTSSLLRSPEIPTETHSCSLHSPHPARLSVPLQLRSAVRRRHRGQGPPSCLPSVALHPCLVLAST